MVGLVTQIDTNIAEMCSRIARPEIFVLRCPANYRVDGLGNLDLARNLAIGEGVNRVCCT